MITELLKKLFSFIFPYTCIICGSEETQINVCVTCRSQLPLTREMRRPWLLSLYRYRDNMVATCVHYLKEFPDDTFAHALMAEKKFMITGWTMGALRVTRCNSIVLIPTPIHRSRFLDRGYNQAEVIAGALRQILRNTLTEIPITVENDFVIKSRKTDKQALITDREKRLKNIHNAFSIKSGKDALHLSRSLVIIIDDVTTTGGTLDEMRNLLLPHAKAVFAFTLAH